MFPNVLKIIYDSKQNKYDISSASFELSNWRPLQIDNLSNIRAPIDQFKVGARYVIFVLLRNIIFILYVIG